MLDIQVILWPCTTCQEFNDNALETCANCGTRRATVPKKLDPCVTDRFNELHRKFTEGKRAVSKPSSSASKSKQRKSPATSPHCPVSKHGVFVLPPDLTKETKGGNEGTEDNKKEEKTRTEFSDVEKYGIIEVVGDDLRGRKVVVFSACKLPPNGKFDYKKLLKYIRYTLNEYVEKDYVIVYFHCGLTEKNKPKDKWLVEAYKGFDRKYKKNLKSLYIVHPTSFIERFLNIFRSIISAKFGKKIVYVNYLTELKNHVDLEQLNIPQAVLDNDALEVGSRDSGPPITQQFGVTLQYIKDFSGRIVPIVVEQTIEYLKIHGLKHEGIFRKSAVATTLKEVKKKYNQGETVEFSAEGHDIHTAAVLLKTFLRELDEPILTFELFDPVIKLNVSETDEHVSEVEQLLHDELPEDNYIILKYIVQFLQEIIIHSDMNKMTSENLATMFGPNLLWSKEKDTQSTITSVNSFAHVLIKHFDEVFKR